MSYTKTTWIDRDTITAEKLNNLENGVETMSVLVPAPQETDAGKVLTVGQDGTTSWEVSAGGTCNFHYLTNQPDDPAPESAQYGEFVRLSYSGTSVGSPIALFWADELQDEPLSVACTVISTGANLSVAVEFNAPNATDAYITFQFDR